MKKIILFTIILFMISRGNAQMTQSNPQIPTMASIGSFFTPEVAMHSGSMNYTVPFYEVHLFGYELPIDFVYSYNGLRYGDEASQVGLHWSLNIPSINRSVLGEDDFDQTSGFAFIPTADRNIDKTDIPDVFTIDIPNYSAQFIFSPSTQNTATSGTKTAEILNNTGKIRTITYYFPANEIIAETMDGVQYTFSQRVNTQKNENDNYTTQWNIRKITLQNNSEIHFSYISQSLKLKNVITNSYFWGYSLGGTPVSNTFEITNTYLMDEVCLDKITWAEGEIYFSYTDRTDLHRKSGTSSARKLGEIKVYNRKNELIRAGLLNHSYFVGTDNIDYKSKRLKLDGLTLYGTRLEQAKKYLFTYDPSNLPNKNSTYKYFGYDSLNVVSAALKEIKHPTGGLTKIQYERNSYGNTLTDIHHKHLGARVASIEHWENANEISRRKRYDYKYPNGTSSGKVHSTYRFEVTAEPGSPWYRYSTEDNWFAPVYQTQIVGYDMVTVIEENPLVPAETIKTEHYFINNATTYPPSSSHSTFAMAKYDYANGNIRNIKALETVGSTSTRVVKELTMNNELIRNPKTFHYYYQYPGTSTVSSYLANIEPTKIRPLSITDRHSFFESNSEISPLDSLVINKEYKYEAYVSPGDYEFLPKEISEHTQNGLGKTMLIKYPHNFSLPLLKNRKTAVETHIKYDESALIAEGELLNFSNASQLTPSETYKLSKLPLSSVHQSVFNNISLTSKDANFIKKSVVHDFDQFGNPIEVQNLNEAPIAYRYDPTGINLVAKVENCKRDEFYYESFEELNSALSLPTAVGEKYRLGDFTVPFIKPNTRNYIIDYKYLTTSGNWESISKPYINNMVLTEGEGIDEVRVYPQGAQLTTYTYKPLVGMTSRTDARGITEHYEYDGFGRLSAVKDFSGHIIKTYCYNYAGEHVDCSPPLTIFKNIVKRQDFKKNNCPTGQNGSDVTYIVPAGKYTSTVSQEDADAQAQDDIDANGQSFANQYGSCSTPTPPTSTLILYNNTEQDLPNVSISLWQGTVQIGTYLLPEDAGGTAIYSNIPPGVYRVDTHITVTNPSQYTFELPTLGLSGTGNSSFNQVQLVAGGALIVELEFN
ncbi:DUF5977 domain-containing protein [Sphingobacterium haloxyli]|uniref:DUF5977 domain-containing protein n=1 Tax=Sphingobacterium haloxyli TaxID=2100533 RepID=A0A2S9J0I3_9SPHI|nr:DUF5977 domain-containing protein [Sphingobacterium haloxyli]PRD46270.1 hypothetical protein C5745_15905 [Sphingobacterium haloxyli]